MNESFPKHERFLELFLPLQSGLQTYLRTLIPNRVDAEDVLQAAAVVMWEKFDEYRPEAPFDCWAYQIAHIQALCFLTKRKRSKLVFCEEMVALLAAPTTALSKNTKDTRDALDLCVEKLSEKDRELLRLRFEHGATNRSVASSLGCSEGTVSRALSWLYDNLLECIEQQVVSEPRGGSE